jgi:menaquinone-dependent protoporphyrinogen oxidase
MHVLVTYASKHGSTSEIAKVIADDLKQAGMQVELTTASDVETIQHVDAVIIGSAIYVGQWQQSALDLIDRHQSDLQAKPVWLFSSGPIGEDPVPKEEPPITDELLVRTGAIEHQSFMGKLDRSSLGFGERLVTSVLRAPEGDFRDWDAIRAWAASIASTLKATGVPVTEIAE